MHLAHCSLDDWRPSNITPYGLSGYLLYDDGSRAVELYTHLHLQHKRAIIRAFLGGPTENGSMETSFAFVDGTNVDKSTRKMMRRHVMMGKNAGKTIHRRSKRDLLLRRHAAPVTAPPPSSCSMALAAKESGAAFAITPSQYAWERVCPISLCPQVLDTFRFPVTLTRHNVEVISNCMPRRWCFASLWLSC